DARLICKARATSQASWRSSSSSTVSTITEDARESQAGAGKKGKHVHIGDRLLLFGHAARAVDNYLRLDKRLLRSEVAQQQILERPAFTTRPSAACPQPL